MKRIIMMVLVLGMLLSFASCKKGKDADGDANKSADADAALAAANDAIKLPDVVKGTITFKGLGMVSFEIYPNVARQSCLNFIYLAQSGHFNGIIVDRLVKDFVIQAGTYQSGFVRRPTEFEYSIKGEFSENGVENTLGFTKGVMAWTYNGTDYDSASTEFCIYVDSTTCWDLKDKYAAFGYVTGEDSFKILNKINKRKTYAEKPVKEIMITSVTLEPIEQEGFVPEFEFPKPNFIKKAASNDAKTSGAADAQKTEKPDTKKSGDTKD